jgi:hypothetical protein
VAGSRSATRTVGRGLSAEANAHGLSAGDGGPAGRVTISGDAGHAR